MKTFVIGDIHGCYAEFQDLLDTAGIGDNDQIIALGDIVDRGPEPVPVVEVFRTHPNALSLAGNHERKHVRARQGELRPALSQIITRWQYEQAGADYNAAATFMSTLPPYLELPDAILVHAYLEPGVPLEQQRLEVLVGHISGDHYLHQTYNRPWYELYDRDKPVIVGHRNYHNTLQPFVYQDRVFGLDTSVYQGMALTGLILPDFRLISVQASRNHWHFLKLDYTEAQKKTPDQEDRPEVF